VAAITDELQQEAGAAQQLVERFSRGPGNIHNRSSAFKPLSLGSRSVLGRWRSTARAVAELLGCDLATVRRWIHRYNTHGVAGLGDLPRSGRPVRVALAGLLERYRPCLPVPLPFLGAGQVGVSAPHSRPSDQPAGGREPEMLVQVHGVACWPERYRHSGASKRGGEIAQVGVSVKSASSGAG
jgi:hypothetical protein